ncbi:MAG: hypothetical protein ACKO8U_03235, partial [Pirellula sp.]
MFQKRRVGSKAFVIVALLGVGILSSTGCTAVTGLSNMFKFNNDLNEYIMNSRAYSMSGKAWHARKHCFVDQKYLKDFQRGFRAGYMQVADSGSGCTPAFPPVEYWNWCYQSAEGQARVAAWFAGFPHGAQAAEEEGVGMWNQLQTSSSIQQQYVDHSLLPSQYNGQYPVPPFDRNRSLLGPGIQSDVPMGFVESEIVAPQVAPVPNLAPGVAPQVIPNPVVPKPLVPSPIGQ